MAVTTIIAEILIAGILALAWLLLLFLGLTDSKGLQWREAKDWIPVLALPLTALCYALGVVVDRVADSLFKFLSKRLENVRKQIQTARRAPETGTQQPKGKDEAKRTEEEEAKKRAARKKRGIAKNSVMRLTVMGETASAEFLAYVRNRMRIARSLWLNSAGLTGAGVLWATRHERGDLVMPILAVGLTVFCASSFATERIRTTHDARLEEAWGILQTRKREEAKREHRPSS